MTPEESKALRRMSRNELKAKAEGMGITVDPGWGQPKLVSMILKVDAGHPANQAPVVQEADDVSTQATVASTTEDDSAAFATARRRTELESAAAQDLMRRQTEMMEQSRARQIGSEGNQHGPAITVQEIEHRTTGSHATRPFVPSAGPMGDEELHEMLDAWARTFVVDFERIEEERAGDVLSIRIISRHGMTKCDVSGVLFTRSGVKEAMAHLRKQAEG